MDPVFNALFVLAVPLAAALSIFLFFRRQGNVAAGISVAAAGLILVFSLGLIFGGERPEQSWAWLEIGDFAIPFGVLFNDLAALMLFIVAFVGFFIHVFSLSYMKEDESKARFFGGLSLFMFSMIGLVLADSLILLFVFWELVGISSYLLINHWYGRPSAVAASKKAFIVNRIGDIGFLVGVIWAYWQFGTFSLTELAGTASGNPELLQAGIGLLLFCGAVAKSGQIPLHVWLPDAMEGPTPVSALIHAATMVAAGVYLLCRVYFLMVPDVLNVILAIGTATAVLASITAVVQRDIKKILAYSTISQLGFMVAAFGLGALAGDGSGEAGVRPLVLAGGAAAMFHLATHAFFKALLFLGSGSIIHACHHEQDIYRMGGLRKKMPLTFLFFTIGYLALIGVPGLAGFFSKDAILFLAWENNKLVFAFLGFAAFMTAFYMTRLWATAFFGEAKTKEAEHARENGLTMTVPLGVLALGALISGYGFAHPEAFAGILDRVPHATGTGHVAVLVVSVAVVLLGFGLAWIFYRPGSASDRLEATSPAVFGFFSRKWFFDSVYEWYVAKVQQRVANLLSFLDQILVAGLAVRGTAGFLGLFGLGAKAGYTGNLHGYVYWFFIGLLLLSAVAFGIF